MKLFKNIIFGFITASLIIFVIGFLGPVLFGGGTWSFLSDIRSFLISLFGGVTILRFIALIAAGYISYLTFIHLKRVRFK